MKLKSARIPFLIILINITTSQRFQSGQSQLSPSEEIVFQKTAFLSREDDTTFSRSDRSFTLYTYSDSSDRHLVIPKENNYYTVDFSTIMTSALTLKPKNQPDQVEFSNNTNFKFKIEFPDDMMYPESVSVRLTDSNCMFLHTMFGYEGLFMMNMQNFNVETNKFYFLFGYPTTGVKKHFEKNVDLSNGLALRNPNKTANYLYFFCPFFESEKLTGKIDFFVHFRDKSLKHLQFREKIDLSDTFENKVKKSTELYKESETKIEDYVTSKQHDSIIHPLNNPHLQIYSIRKNLPSNQVKSVITIPTHLRKVN